MFANLRNLVAVVVCAFTSSTLVRSQASFAGFPEDWSHHHVVFSNPGSADDAVRDGTYAKWSTIVNNPRFQFQEHRRRALRDWAGWDQFKPEALKTDWSMSLGSGATVGAGQYPAKYSFSYTSANCSDWVTYNTGLAGVSGGQANIEAYTNLYATTCAGTVPGVSWAYYSGGGKALTSPVISLDGTKVAYIENSGTGAILRIIKWKSGEGTAAASVPPGHLYTNTTAGNGSNTPWSTCPSGSSCMISIAFQNSKQDTISAPFYEYTTADTLWVGDASGNLHEFTGVFNGTPGEVTTGGWPIAVSGNILTSPVFDSVSGNIFVADSGGYLYSYKASTAAHEMSTSKMTYASGTTGIIDAPLVDSNAGYVYVAVGDDANTSGSVGCDNATGCSGVFQFPTTSTTKATTGVSCVGSSATAWTAAPGGDTLNCGVEAVFGVGSYPNMYNGSFDNSYYTAGTGKAGYLWQCAPSDAGGTVIAPRLSAIAMQSSGSIVPTGDVVAFSNVTTAISSLTSNTSGVACSPVTEFYNTGNSSTVTTINETGGITAASGSVTVASAASGIAAGNYIQIDSEIILVTAASGTTLTITRGQLNTTAATHNNHATITIPAVDYLYFAVTKNGNITPNALNCTTGACLYSVAVGTSTGAYVATCNTGASPHTGNCPTNGVAEAGGSSGIVIDNYGTGTGESQLYFTPLANQVCAGNGTSGSSGTAGCAIQTSQTAP
ncbi:MAG: hypothetical protein ABSD70_10635 [Terracidiphilus sp.]|jgi:hypothetical protein